MGESTHGTQDFYQARIALSQYLIENKGFQAIAIEGDWTSTYPIHRYCKGEGDKETPESALTAFKRFPTWMWRNTQMYKFIKYLRHYNDQFSSNTEKIGFYGLDLYCINESAQAVINYLQQYHQEAAEKTIQRYSCFENAKFNPQLYGYLTDKNLTQACTREVTKQFLEMQHLIYQTSRSSLEDNDKLFYILQNARIVKNAEKYYRALLEPYHITWNIRDQHMADTLQNIIAHIENTRSQPAKVIVWAHNSHIGDSRATEMFERNQLNLGQLVRERFNTTPFLLGFSTAVGSVTAASEWDGPASYKKIQAPLTGSYEYLFHQLKEKNFLLNLNEDNKLTHLLKVSQLQRAIGVIYHPHTERMSHYYFSHLAYQFNALLHLDITKALIPLDKKRALVSGDIPDTYPVGF